MRLGIVSDTHGEVWTTQEAIRVFERHQVDLVIHCGDVGPPEMIPLFSRWPSHFVFGNVDDAGALREAIRIAGQTCCERFGRLEVAGRSIAFLHGDDGMLLRQTILSGQWDVVCHGHTHRAAKFFQGRTLVVNPGAIQRTNCPSVAVVDLVSLETTQIDL